MNSALGPDVGLLSFFFSLLYICVYVCIDRVPYSSYFYPLLLLHIRLHFSYPLSFVCAAPRELFERYDAILGLISLAGEKSKNPLRWL